MDLIWYLWVLKEEVFGSSKKTKEYHGLEEPKETAQVNAVWNLRPDLERKKIV